MQFANPTNLRIIFHIASILQMKGYTKLMNGHNYATDRELLASRTRKNPVTSRLQGYQNNAIFIKKELKISQEAELTLLEGDLSADASAIDIVVPST